MTYLLFAVALSLSAVAAWYAIAGLVAIFAGSTVAIIIMGSLLEASKLVVASWLYRNWKQIPKLLKTYFVFALIILMLLTSMGIFGFLSKAHLDHGIPLGDVQAKLALLDEKIKTEKENINASRAALAQLDKQVDQTIARTDTVRGAERSITIRRAQQTERTKLLNEISAAQVKITKYQEDRAPLAAEFRKVEADVGPLKYIAALIYGDNTDSALLEKAVRWVIIMIVIVFDPLAVLMLVAANWQLKYGEKKDEFRKLPLVSKEAATTTETKTAETKKEIVLQDVVDVDEDHLLTQREERVLKESSDIEIPEIKVDEHNKDWEPNLFDRIESNKQVGRYMAETGKKPPKVQIFLNKVQSLFADNNQDPQQK